MKKVYKRKKRTPRKFTLESKLWIERYMNSKEFQDYLKTSMETMITKGFMILPELL